MKMHNTPKIFCVSFHKSGTTSLHRFLLEAGIKSMHYPRSYKGVFYRRACKPTMTARQIMDKLAPVVKAFDAHMDAPWPGLLSEILADHADARIILLTRDPEQWWKSLSKHWKLETVPSALNNFERIQYRDYLGEKAVVTLRDKDIMIAAYKAHIERVRLAVPAEQLFEARLDDPQLGQKLSEFLGLKTKRNFPKMQNKNASQPNWRVLLRRYWRLACYVARSLRERIHQLA